MTVEAFLDWAMEQPGRYELESGRVVAVAPERLGHVRAKTASVDALRMAIARATLPCEALPDGAAARVDAKTLHEPDALVFCGAAPSGDALAIVSPVVVLEVVSPSSGSRDHNQKLVGYFTVPSAPHHLIVHPDRRILIHHARRADEIATRILHGGPLAARSAGAGSRDRGPVRRGDRGAARRTYGARSP